MTNRIRSTDVDNNMTPDASARLLPLTWFHPRPKETIGLPGDAFVLTFPVSAMDVHLLSKDNDESQFGFGHVELGDRFVLTIRLQMGGLQVYWVGDMTDPEIWAAIDSWKRARHVPIMFEVESPQRRERLVGVMPVSGIAFPQEVRRNPDRAPTVHTWHDLKSLADSGLLQVQATTDIPGIPLRHVLSSAILTKRLEPFVNQRPPVRKPVPIKTHWVPAQ
ncbi:hypothetical protein [Paraburkholderia sp. BR14374]|uniref:hypothetical protein n=1 Tax=Paraburkholderia sp. BR14374 TaxID=3237007 RepID=UPI0034CF8527